MRRTGLVLAAALLTAAAAGGCASSAAKSPAGSSANGGATTAAASPTTTAKQDPIASCAEKVDTWVTTTFLLGKDDLGDYQEMGLSGAEGMALRNLEQQLGKTIKTFPAPAPADLHAREVQACQAAGAGAANQLGWQ